MCDFFLFYWHFFLSFRKNTSTDFTLRTASSYVIKIYWKNFVRSFWQKRNEKAGRIWRLHGKVCFAHFLLLWPVMSHLANGWSLGVREISWRWRTDFQDRILSLNHVTLKELWSWNTENLKTQPILYQKTLACYRKYTTSC